MDKFATENLILLEFLVDQVNLEYSVQQELKHVMGETCVSFQFLDNAPLFVCEEDFAPKKRSYDEGCVSGIKNGKSCLFSMSPDQAHESTKTFDIYVEVFKKMKPGVLPDKVQVGESLISIVNLFHELIDSVASASDEQPAAKTLKDCFKINNAAGELVGHINVYIRMSCFGKLIVTQFQMNLEEKSVEFKAREGHYLFKYNKKGGGGPDGPGGPGGPRGPGGPGGQGGRGQSGRGPRNQNCPQVACDQFQDQGGMQQRGGPQNPYCPQMPCDQYQDPGGMQQRQQYGGPQQNQSCPQTACDQSGGMYPGQNIMGMESCPYGSPSNAGPQTQMGQMNNQGYGGPACAMPQGYGMQQPQQGGQNQPPCNECGAPAPGMMQPQQMQQQQYQTPCNECGAMPMPNQMQNQPMGQGPCNVCARGVSGTPADDGCFQEIGAQMGPNALTIRVHKDKNKVEPIDTDADEDGCTCGPPRPSKARARANAYPQNAPQDRQSNAYRMGPGTENQPNAPFQLKMGGGCNPPTKTNVNVMPPTAIGPDGTQVAEISDPTKDVFILRIGKKSDKADKKSNLELELCTPKGNDIKPPPKKETRDTQYEDQQAEGGGKKGGKDKGKKGKGGKGGKGKKGKKI